MDKQTLSDARTKLNEGLVWIFDALYHLNKCNNFEFYRKTIEATALILDELAGKMLEEIQRKDT